MHWNRKWCNLKHAHRFLYYDQVARIPLRSAIKPFRELHGHTMCNKLINSMEDNPSWEANSHSASQEIFHLFSSRCIHSTPYHLFSPRSSPTLSSLLNLSLSSGHLYIDRADSRFGFQAFFPKYIYWCVVLIFVYLMSHDLISMLKLNCIYALDIVMFCLVVVNRWWTHGIRVTTESNLSN
jgi:hypothetical protein